MNRTAASPFSLVHSSFPFPQPAYTKGPWTVHVPAGRPVNTGTRMRVVVATQES